ncbi:DUF4269 domain-containing protein [Evansella tamaricis]|uniref:DUF4269 domain-containing protein n=1 Tax=Evansella tamaricis TaxID=2069301 RepID=A0ABS6JFB5_9BACI|nr:DUF4269 domain-containing protein [Evansella tamaricis]MBU9712301.1 DUF4269 domain-containing protein [Evansella tamaricis]
MLHFIEQLKFGNEKQQRAYYAISKLGIMEDLGVYNPILCGTLPIQIDIIDSDLDIIMEVYDFKQFEIKVRNLYENTDNFKLKEIEIRNRPVIKANFHFQGFEFELFGQAQPVNKQNAYLHMVIESKILEENPTMKEKIISLKKQGYKTEPAFCKVLGLTGDPYISLLEFGKANGYLE